MTPLQTFIAHLVTVLALIGAAVALAVNGTIDGATAVTIIAAAGGITLGAVVTTGGANVANIAANNATNGSTTAATPASSPPAVASVRVVPPTDAAPSGPTS
ncbi:MAG: hypothetical protein ABSD62_14605 [Candidatus Limnocylindrales bacterium]|jgi:hypothetical protein